MAKKKHSCLRRISDHLVDHVWPHHRNKHVPHLLHHRTLFGLSTLLIGLKVLTVLASLSLPAHAVWSSAITPENIIDLTNKTRSSLGLSELRTDDKLMAAAQAKAEDMVAKGYFSHTSPDGTTPWYWFKTYDYSYRSAGENLAAHFLEAEDVQAGWMASPKHRDNIVSQRFDEIGVGVAQGVFENYPTTFVVQLFGYEIGDIHDITPTQVPEDTLAPSTLIDLSRLTLTPLENAYYVEVPLTNVATATVTLGESATSLLATPGTDLWQGTLPYQPELLSKHGELMSLAVQGINGNTEAHDLAWIMPDGQTPEMYAFAAPTKETKLLGVFDVAQFDDGVQKFYISVMVVLGVLLAIAVFTKMHLKRPTIVAGTFAVIGLALILSVL